jgi:hypothetical protein
MNKALQHTKSTLKEWREKLRGTPRKSEQDLLTPGDPPRKPGAQADADDEDFSFCARHFGTDALLGSWCLLVASALYALYAADLVVEAWDSEDVPKLTFAWGNAVSGLMFTVGAAYFVNLSYPEEMERCAQEALTVDLESLTFVERTFTFNDMLLATWSFELACVPYVVISFTYLFDGHDYALGALCLVGSVVCMACLYVWVLSAMPSHMQQNGGNGSSRFYDALVVPCFGGCCDRELKKHLGTDLQAGGWLFFGPTAVATVGSAVLVLVAPKSFDAWSFFVQLALLSVGAGLLLRSMYPPEKEEAPLLG